jgi:hypothetical protein
MINLLNYAFFINKINQRKSYNEIYCSIAQLQTDLILLQKDIKVRLNVTLKYESVLNNYYIKEKN